MSRKTTLFIDSSVPSQSRSELCEATFPFNTERFEVYMPGDTNRLRMANAEFEIVRATSADSDRVFEYLYEHYHGDEPVTKATKHKKEKDDCASAIYLKCNMSFLAVRKEDPNTICGVALSNKMGQCEDEFDALFSRRKERYGGTPFEKAFILFRNNSINFYKQIENQCWDNSENNATLEIFIVSVRKEDRQKRLAQLLLDHTIAFAKEHNFRWLMAECTSSYTAQLFKRTGFRMIAETRYEDYFKDQDGNDTLEIEAPHAAMVNLIRDLGVNPLRCKL